MRCSPDNRWSSVEIFHIESWHLERLTFEYLNLWRRPPSQLLDASPWLGGTGRRPSRNLASHPWHAAFQISCNWEGQPKRRSVSHDSTDQEVRIKLFCLLNSLSYCISRTSSVIAFNFLGGRKLIIFTELRRHLKKKGSAWELRGFRPLDSEPQILKSEKFS